MELKFRSLEKNFKKVIKIADPLDNGLIAYNEFAILLRTIE